jgi:type IV secretion system protein VirB10
MKHDEQAALQDDSFAGRHIPTLSDTSDKSNMKTRLAVMIGVIAIVAIGGGTYFANKMKESYQAEKAAREDVPKSEAKPTNTLPIPDDFQAAPAAAIDQTLTADTDSEGIADTTTQSISEDQALAAQREAQIAQERAQRLARWSSPLIAFPENGTTSAGLALNTQPTTNSSTTTTNPALAATSSNPSTNGGGSLADNLRPDRFGAVEASRFTNPNLMLSQGSLARCVLQTAIDSTLPGMVSCVLADDLYSTNGKVVLAERGTKFVGQYQSGRLKQGMKRIFLIWTRAETPKGVLIPIDSPASDALGRSGITGNIDNHFFQRFGAGLFLSVVDDVGNAYIQRQNESEGDVYTSTTSSAQNMAEIAVQNSIDIPPTLNTKPGQLINIFVARDVDFSNIYGLVAK